MLKKLLIPAAMLFTSGALWGQFEITNSSPLPSGMVDVPYNAVQLQTTGGTGAVTFTLAQGSQQWPAGITMSGSGLITGTPTAHGTVVGIVVLASDSANHTATKSFQISVTPGLEILTQGPLAGGTTGVPYSQQLNASGGSIPYTWSVPIGSLPAGLLLGSTTGIISGTPTAAGTANFTVEVSDNGGYTKTRNYSINIVQALEISTTTLPQGVTGTAYNGQLAAIGGTSPYTAWAVTQGALPAGITLNPATGALTGTPTATGTFTPTFEVTDSANAKATRAISIVVIAPVIITSSSPLPSGALNQVYSYTLTASGGAGSYTWSITSGALPNGITLTPATGVLSGTPTATGQATFTARVADTAGNSATKDFVLTVNAVALVIQNTSPLPAGIVGVSYTTVNFTATGGSGTGQSWSVLSGSLPPGLQLSAGGALTGTPTTAGDYSFTIQVIDSTQSVAQKAFTLAVSAPLSITTASPLPGAVQNEAYSQTLAATGGTGTGYVWSVAGGLLPGGLTLSSGGVLSGSPTGAGSYNFTLRVTDSSNATAEKAFQLIVAGPLAITTTQVPDGQATVPYSFAFTATGGTQPYTWSLVGGGFGSPPAGIELTAAGFLTGVPTTPGAVGFSVRVTDGAGHSVTAPFSMTISNAPLTITKDEQLASGSVGMNYTETMTATGGTLPLVWTVFTGNFPPGLTLMPAGVITGKPTVSGIYQFTLKVTDAVGNSVTKGFRLPVSAAPLSVTTTSPLPQATVGSPFTFTLRATGGNPALGYTWSLLGESSALPPGLGISSGGIIFGTPTSVGTYTFIVQVSNGSDVFGAKQLTLTVGPAGPLSILTTTLLHGVVASGYSQNLVAIGGTGPYTWSIVNGSLPAGLTLDASGLISGTPTTANSQGAPAITFQVRDSAQATLTRDFTITIYPTLSITTESLANAQTGVAYQQTLAATGGSGVYLNWLVNFGALPAGLNLNSSTGAIVGAATETGVFVFAVQVTDSANNMASKTYAITVTDQPVLTIITSSLVQGTVNTAYTAVLTAAGGSGGYTYELASGQLPPGLTLGASGLLNGTPSAAGSYTFTVRVRDTAATTATRQYTLVIISPLTITTTVVAPASLGVAYSQTLSASGGTGAGFVWNVAAGLLPAGITLSAGGVLSGAPTAPGTFNFTARVLDSGSNPATQAYTLVVNTSLSISPTTLPAGTQGSAYAQALTATGGSGTGYTWSVFAGQPPAGITLSPTGLLSGTPTSAGISTFTVRVIDSANNQATQQYSLTVSGSVTITTISLPAGVVGVFYSQTLNAAGGTGTGYQWSVASGAFPAGLILSTNGLVSGTPTTLGVSQLTVRVTDSGNNSAQQSYSVTINTTLSVTTTSLPSGTVGQPYSQSLTASGGTSPYTWSSTGTMPPGLALNPSTGILAGTPTVAGSYSVTFQATDSAGASASRVLAINIVQPGAARMSVSQSALRFGYVAGGGRTGSQTVSLSFFDVAGAPTWTASTNQPGITVTPSSGAGSALLQITATGTTSGTITITSPAASNSPITIAVTVFETGNQQPIGSFDTPTEGLSVYGAVAVTGWMLDNTEITRVEIWRDPVAGEATGPTGLVYIGDAIFVPGTRPDVEAAFPALPLNYRAGWGYHLLTNYLPNTNGTVGHGNGTHRLWAIGYDREGNRRMMGPRTIIVNNNAATKPFGTIDLPAQGGVASGTSYRNSGWMLTPQTCQIPFDAHGTSVIIDGQEFANVLNYNLYRADVAALFPGYKNSNGSYAYFDFDTTRFANGLHTIAWLVGDDCGRYEGLGSRFFTVLNGSSTADKRAEREARIVWPHEVADLGPVEWTYGYASGSQMEPLTVDDNGVYRIAVEEMDRLEINLGPGAEIQRDLPVGASMEDGVFYWLLAPGYLSEHQLEFRRGDGSSAVIVVNIQPRK